MSDANNLPLAIHNPIAIFDNTNGKDAGRVILTELKMNGRNFIVVVQVKEQRRREASCLRLTKFQHFTQRWLRVLLNGSLTTMQQI